MAPQNLSCPICGKKGFRAKGPLNSHMKAVHPHELALNDDNSYEVTYRIQKVAEPGPHMVECAVCKHPRQVWIKKDGTIASSNDPEVPKPQIASSSDGKDRKQPKRNALPIVIRERYKMRWNEEKGRWKHTVAMMGTHGKTAPEMPWFELGVEEKWLLNDSHGIPYVTPHMKAGKVTRWWQLHHRWRITRRATRNATDHWQWLQDVKTVPRIIMQRHYREVPKSEAFPLREVCDMFLPGLLGRGAGYVQYYFTNTFSYMFAQVLYEKEKGIKDWERVELYGCELEQLETEYFRQRPGIEFWFGMCVKAGIEIYVPESCFMAYAQDIKVNQLGQQQMLQYPGYMAYGYLSPSMEEVKERNVIHAQHGEPQEILGVDPREESVLMAWDDSPYMDHVYALNEGISKEGKIMNLENWESENVVLNEWLDGQK